MSDLQLMVEVERALESELINSDQVEKRPGESLSPRVSRALELAAVMLPGFSPISLGIGGVVVRNLTSKEIESLAIMGFCNMVQSRRRQRENT